MTRYKSRFYKVTRLSDGKVEEGDSLLEIAKKFGYQTVMSFYYKNRFKVETEDIKSKITITNKITGEKVTGTSLTECARKLGYKTLTPFYSSNNFIIEGREKREFKKYSKTSTAERGVNKYSGKRFYHNNWKMIQYDISQGVVFAENKSIKYSGELFNFTNSKFENSVKEKIYQYFDKRNFKLFIISATNDVDVEKHKVRFEIYFKFPEHINKGYMMFEKFKEEALYIIPLLDEIDTLIDDFVNNENKAVFSEDFSEDE